ncbi:hypothetical protein SPRG_21568 [Saprolegnia parasitica CBS 223.65]|uniref:Reverse transcriptase domain-containing protein n=1 Tax=Saprolegnia parasitica (strain CBS 223.65) TaxID=695850 RepID=A0A067BJD2_SAPPC|nr:hypothetical protein SPRG_21568 [Saprolegnia parasitica CBS 223.65]KDO18263.1 hypothetical protein SPRG_21568 [Saprolegnia parasitica CBS 223.65]|eukprot:XP_012211029.1 hypothetical protein SPRG_21568 [Saprolegnia parasitica CBS 223.65]
MARRRYTCLNVLSVYALGRPRAKIDRFYDDLDRVLKALPPRDITVIGGDFNAKLGQREANEAFMGRFCRGYRNANGEALADLCVSHDLEAVNTMFPKRAKNLTTWTRNCGSCTVHNQIDYVLCPRAMVESCLDAHSSGRPPDPNKPQGVCSSLRPMVLLNCILKAVSVMVLKRIQPKLDEQIGAYQSGFRPGRSTADVVWSHKWCVARIRQYKEQFSILGIDVSRAFDSIDRAKLLTVLRGFLDNDEVGTWALTPTSLADLDSFYRRQLRRLLGIFHPSKLSVVARQRWRLLGLVLPMSPIVLHRDLQSLTPPQSLASLEDLNQLRSFADDNKAWKAFTQRVVMGLIRGHKHPRTTTEEQNEPAHRRLRSHGPVNE